MTVFRPAEIGKTGRWRLAADDTSEYYVGLAVFGDPDGKQVTHYHDSPEAAMSCSECARRCGALSYRPGGQEVIDFIVSSGLLHAECTEDKEHPVVVVWSQVAVDQLNAFLYNK